MTCSHVVPTLVRHRMATADERNFAGIIGRRRKGRQAGRASKRIAYANSSRADSRVNERRHDVRPHFIALAGDTRPSRGLPSGRVKGRFDVLGGDVHRGHPGKSKLEF